MAKEATTYLGLSKEGRLHAVANAETVKQLDAMWAAWEGYGFSREGQLHGLVLAKKADLGAELSDEELHLIDLTHRRAAHGRTLPAIKGKRGGGA